MPSSFWHLTLPSQELSGVVRPFDTDEDGTVNVAKFSKAFFKMGVEGRSRASKERREVEAVRLDEGPPRASSPSR